jgi:hypothetical protein
MSQQGQRRKPRISKKAKVEVNGWKRKTAMKQNANSATSLRLDLSRRDFVASASAAAASGFAVAQGSAWAAIGRADMTDLPPYANSTLPPSIRSRSVANVNGLTVHILEAGYEVPGRPALLLHGFPELAYSWRKVMLPLAAAGILRDRPRSARLRPHDWLG